MFGKLIGNIIGKVVGEDAGNSVIEYFDNKQKLKHEYKLTKLQLRIERLKQEGEWSRGMVEQMAGWKDEFVLLLISVPLVTAPIWPERTLAVFATLDTTPEWYRYMLITIFLAIYGLKPALDKLGFWRK